MDIHFKTPENKNYSLHNNLLSSVSMPRMATHVPTVLTKEVTPKTPCSNQKSSGRCWIFAALNMIRRQDSTSIEQMTDVVLGLLYPIIRGKCREGSQLEGLKSPKRRHANFRT